MEDTEGIRRKMELKQKMEITSMMQNEGNETFNLSSVHNAVVIGVVDVKGGSDEILAVVETGVPGVCEGLPFDAETSSYVQQFLAGHLGQQMSQAAHCEHEVDPWSLQTCLQ